MFNVDVILEVFWARLKNDHICERPPWAKIQKYNIEHGEAGAETSTTFAEMVVIKYRPGTLFCLKRYCFGFVFEECHHNCI